MATFDGAVVEEQGVTFAIVVVRRGILSQHSSSIEKVRNSFFRSCHIFTQQSKF